MLNLFFVLAIASFVLFILILVARVQLIKHYRRVTNASRFTVFLSWLLIIIFFGSLGGIVYGVGHPNALPHFHYNRHKQETLQTKLQQKEAKQKAKQKVAKLEKKVKFAYTPVNPKLDGNGEAKVKFILPRQTTVRVIGAHSGVIYATFSSSNKVKEISKAFNNSGDYLVKVTTNGKTTNYKMTIADQ